MEHHQFLVLTAKMRQAQKNFFAAKTPQSKKHYQELSIALEKQVDDQITATLGNQINLFQG